jgi:hypothetical protein
MTPDRYVSSTALASNFRSGRYRESVMYNQNIPTDSEWFPLDIQDETKREHVSIIYFTKSWSRYCYLKISNRISFLNSNVCAIIHGPCIMSTIRQWESYNRLKCTSDPNVDDKGLFIAP